MTSRDFTSFGGRSIACLKKFVHCSRTLDASSRVAASVWPGATLLLASMIALVPVRCRKG